MRSEIGASKAGRLEEPAHPLRGPGVIYLDTHVVIWLYAGRTELLTQFARASIDANDLRVSPVVALELQYLFEAGKTTERASVVLQTLGREIGLASCDLPFAEVANAAYEESWTRDPFDRILVSQVRLRGAPLLTKDRIIHAHCDLARWDDPQRSRG